MLSARPPGRVGSGPPYLAGFRSLGAGDGTYAVDGWESRMGMRRLPMLPVAAVMR